MKVMLVSDSGFQYMTAVLPALHDLGVETRAVAADSFGGSPSAWMPRQAQRYFMDREGLRAFRSEIEVFAPNVLHVMGVRSSLIKSLAALKAFPDVGLVYERISAGGMNRLSPVDPFLFGSSRIDRIVMPSKAMLNNWMGQPYLRRLARPERCEVLHYAFDLPAPTSADEKRALRQGLGLDPDAFVIGTVCHVRPWKNVEFVAEIVASLETPRNVQFAVVGGAYRDAAYMDRIRVAGGSRLKLLGYVPDAHRIAAAFDLHVTPTHLPGESFGMAFAEAMAHGVAGITMNYGASAEVCEHGVSGLALPPSREVWRLAMQQLIDDPQLLARMSAAARARIAERFSPLARARDYQRVYETVVNSGRVGRR